MKHLLIMALFVLSTQAQAQIPGGTVSHTFRCADTSAHPILGVGYKLEISTSGSVAPKHSLRSAALLSTVVYPGATATVTPLEIIKQDATSAQMIDANNSVKVKLNKKAMTAKVKLGDKIILLCRKAVSGGPIGGGFSAGNK